MAFPRLRPGATEAPVCSPSRRLPSAFYRRRQNSHTTQQKLARLGRKTVSRPPYRHRTITSFGLPTTNTARRRGPEWITAGPDDKLWFTESGVDKVGSITAGASPTTTDYALISNSIGDGRITSGPDGALWFVENGNNAVERIDPATKTVIEFKLPNSNSNPWGIVKGPDGALWFTECLGNRIGKLQ